MFIFSDTLLLKLKGKKKERKKKTPDQIAQRIGILRNSSLACY